jgi:hypothetical protein
VDASGNLVWPPNADAAAPMPAAGVEEQPVPFEREMKQFGEAVARKVGLGFRGQTDRP